MYINNTESTLRRHLIKKSKKLVYVKKNKEFKTDLIISFILLLTDNTLKETMKKFIYTSIT